MKRKKKPGYYTLLVSEADDHRTGIGEGMGSRTSDLVALVAFHRWTEP